MRPTLRPYLSLVLWFMCTLVGAAEHPSLANDHVRITVDPATGVWDLVWGANTALRAIGFSVEINAAPIIGAGDGVETSMRSFSDTLGRGRECVQVWKRRNFRVEREIRLYDDSAVVTVGGRIVNESGADARLGLTRLIQSIEWQLGHNGEIPAALFAPKIALTSMLSFGEPRVVSGEQTYTSSGVLTLFNRAPATALTLAYVRADHASPDLEATFRSGKGGTGLAATSRFLNRALLAGASVELNRLFLVAGDDPFRQLEALGDAMAKVSRWPARTGPTALWCSWYAHRMDVNEDRVLANAAVAARHFKPLGFEFMQVDHGWQRGNITGDWIANERFPHGLRWLAGQLRERHGLKLGLWISPTDVAETSELFRQHPDWVLRDEEGKPKVNWKWYWAPKPNCYQLDVTRTDVAEHVRNVFRRLVQEDVAYFKIDFIAAQGKEQFVPQDQTVTRGWPAFRLAMEAVRAGAGNDAWVRYCQGPPLLSVGLADGSYGGDDTADAGQPGLFRLLRDNAQILATSYWLNDRGYHREVCDMSVRMHASIEEARVRAAIMTLANASISWSDELCYLPPSRIRMMQQCLPAGNPPMRPVDLFARAVPSVWHIKAKNNADAWDVVGLFNFEEKADAVRSVRFAELGLDPQAEYAAFEFWEERYLGTFKDGLELSLPPESSRILSLRRVTGKPQLIGTDMHVLQGYHELKSLQWDEGTTTLSGTYQRMPGLHCQAFFLLPDGFAPKFEFPLTPRSARLTHVAGKVWMQEVEFEARDFVWKIPFEKVPAPTLKEPN